MENIIKIVFLYLFYQWWIMDEKNKVDATIDKIKSHPKISYFVLIAIIVVALGSLTDSIDKIIAFTQKYVYHQGSEQSQNVYTQDMTLDSYQVNAIQNGYLATIKLRHSKNEPLGFIAFIATIADNSNATILRFWPTKGQAFAHRDDSQKILENGKMAELFFQPLAVGVISLDLEVSEKTKIFIEGSHNLKSFEIKIL